MGSNIFTFRLSVQNNQEVHATLSGGDETWPGNPKGKLNFTPRTKQRLATLCQVVHTNNASQRQIRQLGHLLFQILFDKSLRVPFLTGYNRVRNQPNAVLRLELDINENVLPDLAALPWEFLCVPANEITGELWLSTDPNVVLSRRSERWQVLPRRELAHDEPIRIAVLVANASDTPGPIHYEALWQQVEQLAQTAPHLFAVKLETQPTKEKVDTLLETFKPHIFHFIGYGRSHQEPGQDNQPSAQIAVLHESGQAKWISATQFSTLFARHWPTVVLFHDAAAADGPAIPIFPMLAAQAMHHHIAVAVALQYPLGSEPAHRFCCEFYRRLGKNEPVDKSVQEGRIFIADWNETRDFASPLLYMRVSEGQLFARQAAPPIATPVPPDSELVRRALLKLNYGRQQEQFQGITFKPQRMGAFLITAPKPRSEPYWLLHKLVTMLPGSHVQDDVIKFDMSMADSPSETELWWETVAERLGLDFGASQNEIITAVHEARAYKNIIFIFDNVGLYPGCEQTILEQFWQPLARGAVGGGQMWQLLFLVESHGRLGGNHLAVTDLTSADWQPVQAVQLPQVNEFFADIELQSWLLQDETKAVEPLRIRLEEDAGALFRAIKVNNGVPFFVMRAIGQLCQFNWQTKKRDWCRKYE